jgi:hypothetical protein
MASKDSQLSSFSLQAVTRRESNVQQVSLQGPKHKYNNITVIPNFHLNRVDYQGPREAKPIVDYLLSNQPSNVRFVNGDPSEVKSKKSITLDDFLGTDVSKRLERMKMCGVFGSPEKSEIDLV